ncbi:MAG: acetoacetate decarboxylase family protein [Deltaproteobacteria bacterium]|nr:acetoacetate decarboxylase family protein [Deltaproteobacteria bacterium]
MNLLKLNKIVVTLIIISLLSFVGPRASSAEDLPAPQLVTDAWMLIIGFEADPEALKAILPPGLEPNPSNLVVMNMYTVPEASQTSGFGAYTLTYLTVQLKDQDSYIMGSSTGEPGRYFAFYFNSSELMKDFTKKVGIPAEEGMTKQTKENGKLTSVLEVGGKPFIVATADVGDELQAPAGGHLNYFGLKKTEMNGKEMTQIMKYPIPFLVRTVKTENATVDFTDNVPKDHPLNRIKPKKVAWASYMKGSFVYPQSVVLKEWESTGKK